MEHIMKEVGDLAFLLFGLGANFFCVLYSIMAKWWKNKGGRFIFTFIAVVAITLDLAMARLYFGPYPGIMFIRPIAYLSMAAVMWWLVGILVVNQVRGSRQHKVLVQNLQNRSPEDDQSHTATGTNVFVE